VYKGRIRHTAILRRNSKAPSAAGVICGFDLLWSFDLERPFKWMIIFTNTECTVRGSLVHISQSPLHVLGREHVDVFNSEGFHDVFQEIVVQTEPRCSHDKLTGPIDVNPIFPPRSRLVYQRLVQNVRAAAGELVDANRLRPSLQLRVEEGVTEPGYSLRVRHQNSVENWDPPYQYEKGASSE